MFQRREEYVSSISLNIKRSSAKCSCLGGKEKHPFHKWYHSKIAAWTCFGKTLVLTSQTLLEQQVKVEVHHYGHIAGHSWT